VVRHFTSWTEQSCLTTVFCRFIPADAIWTFAMACNVYFTFFRNYDAHQLRSLEWKYVLCCYGIPFVPAFTYCFIKSASRGKIYGSAVVSPLQDSLGTHLFRIALILLAMVLGRA
jgi:hypothetical protein